jgi:hypothetical protein
LSIVNHPAEWRVETDGPPEEAIIFKSVLKKILCGARCAVRRGDGGSGV